MAKKKLLDLNGVQRYDTKIKEYIELREDFFRIASGISGTAANTTSGSYRSSLWNGSNPNITTLKHGMTISYRVPVAGNGTYGTLLSINGGDYYPVCANVTSMVSTRYAVGCYVLLTFDSGQTGQVCYSANTKYTASATGTGLSKPGCWKIADYDTNTTAIVNTYSQYKRPYAGTSAITRYKLVVEGADNRIYPIATGDNSGTTKTPIAVSFRPEHIYYYNTGSTTSANAAIAVNSLYVTAANTTPRWTFNETIPTYRNIYLAGDLDSDTGLFTLNDAGVANSTAYYRLVPTNTSSVDYSSLGFIAGKYYVYVGASYSTANYFQLETEHPIYYFDGTNLVPTVARAEQAIKKIPTKTSQLTNDSGFITGYTNTHRDIQVNGTSIGTSATTLNLTGGTAITISNSNGKVTIAHADTSSQATTSNTGRTYIQNIGLDALGHITGVTVATETVTNTHNSHALNVTNGTATAGGSSITYVESVSGCAATSGNLSATTVRKTVTIPSIPDKNVTYSGTVANNGVAVFSGTTGIIKDSGFTIAKSVPSNAVFTDTHRAIGMNETEVLGDNTTKLTLSAGTNVTLSNPSTGVITISATDTNTHNSHALNVTNGTASQVAQGTEITFVESVSGCAATSGNLSANTVRKKVTIPDVSSFITGITNNVVYSGSPVNNQIAVFSGTTGIVKPSGYTIAKSVPSDAVFTDTHNKHSIAVTNGTASAGGTSITYVESGSGETASDGNLALTLTRKTVTIPTVPANTVTGANLSADTIILGNGSSTIKTSNKTITTTLGSDDTTVPTSKAVETAISSALASGVKYRGDFNASTGAISGSTTMTSLKESIGDMFVVSTAGKFAGTDMEVGDSIIFKKNVAAGTAVAATDITYVEGTVSVVTGTTAVTWDTEATLATVEGVAIKIKIPANPDTHNSHALNVTNGTATAGGSSITYVESVSGCAATSGNLSASTVRKTVTIPTVPSKIVTYSGTPVDNQVLVFSGTTGIAKPSGYTIAKSVPSDAVFTDTKVTSAANHYGYSDTSGKTNGLYKITVDKAGHVTSATAVAKSDITALGIPESDTNTWRKVQVNGTDILGNGTSTNPLNLSAGTNVTLSNTNGTVTISATDTNTHRSVNMNGTEVLGNNTTALTLSAGTNVTLSNPSTGVIAISATDTNTHNKHSIVVTNGTATAGGTSITYVESGTGGTASDGNLALTLTRKTVTIPSAANNGTYSIKVSGTSVTTVSDFTADQSTNDDVNFIAGSNITITPNATNRSITIAAAAGTDTKQQITNKTTSTNPIYLTGVETIPLLTPSNLTGATNANVYISSGSTLNAHSGSFVKANNGQGITASLTSEHGDGSVSSVFMNNGAGYSYAGNGSIVAGMMDNATNDSEVTSIDTGNGAIAVGVVNNSYSNNTADYQSYISAADGSIAVGFANAGEGENTASIVTNNGSIAVGYADATESGEIESVEANGLGSIAVGRNVIANGNYSQAFGEKTIAEGNNSHAEGVGSEAYGTHSHAEGVYTVASGSSSHAEGDHSQALGVASHAEGTSTIADMNSMTAVGKYNQTGNTKALFVVGNGTSSARSNAMLVDSDSNITISGGLKKTTGGSSTTVWTTNGGTATLPTDTNTWRPIKVNNNNFLTDRTTALNLSAGTNVTLTTGSTGLITISASGGVGVDSTNRANKLFLVGATTQSSNPDTVGSYSSIYEQQGKLHAEKLEIGTSTEIIASGSNSLAGGYSGDDTAEIEASSNGSIAYGYVSDLGRIESGDYGAFAFGSSKGENGNTDAFNLIRANGEGALAHGMSDAGFILAEGYGSTAMGWMTESSAAAYAPGSLVVGYGEEKGEIRAYDGAYGSLAGGYAYGGIVGDRSRLSMIYNYGKGSIAYGCTVSGGTIQTNGNGSFAGGFVNDVQKKTFAKGNGSFAFGIGASAMGDYSHAEGEGYEFYDSAKPSLSAETSICASGRASFVCGSAESDALIATRGYAYGSFAGGYAYGSNDDHIASITVNNSGGFAFGNAVNGGQIISSGYGSTSIGWAGSDSDYPGTGKIIASNNGSIAVGYAMGGEEGDGKIISEGQGSFAGGYVGQDSELLAHGTGSFAYGTSVLAFGSYSHAEGNSTKAYGSYSHAEGAYTVASGQSSHAEGQQTSAYWSYSHAEGLSTVASGQSSHAEGVSTKAYGSCSHAEGSNTVASGQSSHAEGAYTVAQANYSHAAGYYTSANTAYSYVIGRYNAACASGELFTVGNGTSTSANYKKTAFKIVDDNGSSFGGNVTVTVTGKINASSGFFQTSDINKKNVEGELDLDKAYDLIDKCQTILYTLKDDESKKQEIGLIAQEVQEFFPELISKDTEGNLSLDYSRLTVVILRVLKDLIKRISKLENKE